MLKALGDNTRYAIYLELARSPLPLATAEIAESLDLHPNTVRPHLERMRDVGLLEVETDARGAVGRPSTATRWRPTPRRSASSRRRSRCWPACCCAWPPPAGSAATRWSTPAASRARPTPRRWPGPSASPPTATPTPARCVGGLMARLDALGFDPELAGDDAQVTVGFAHCPFRELAEANPEIVCALHQGLVEGFVGASAAPAVDEFHPLIDRTPCQVDLALTGS